MASATQHELYFLVVSAFAVLHTELDPEHEEDEDENDKSAHLGEGDRGTK